MEQTEASDRLAEWLARCALRDQTAFVALYQATAPKLFGIALRILRQTHRAEETLQEAFLKIWNNAGSYTRAKGSPMTWMISIVRNQAIDLLRATRTQTAELAGDEAMAFNEAHSDGEASQAQAEVRADLPIVIRCLDELQAQQQRCILLIYHKGLTPTEVARQESIPLGTVKTWVRRGLFKLRECIKRRPETAR